MNRVHGDTLGELRKNWLWLMVVGVISVTLGFVAMGMTFAVTMASVFLFGVFFIIGGFVQLVQAFKARGWRSFFLHILIAVSYLIAGGVTVQNPVLASSIFTIMLAWSIIAAGMCRLIMAYQNRGLPGWGLMFFGGIVSLVLGLMIIVRWPASGLFIIGLFIAIELIVNGWTCITVSLAARALSKGPVPEAS